AVHLDHGGGINYRLAQTITAMFEILVLVGQPGGHGMRPHKPGGLGIGGDHVELDTLAGIGIERGAVFRAVVVDVGIGEDAAEFAFVGQEVVLLHRVVVGGVGILRDAAPRMLPALLLGIGMAQGKGVLLVQIPGQLAATALTLVLGIGSRTVALAEEVALVLLVVVA